MASYTLMVLTAGLLRSFNLLLISDFLALVLPFTPLLNMQSSISNTSMEILFSICMKILFSSYLFLSLSHSKMKNTNRLSFLRAGGIKDSPRNIYRGIWTPQKGSWNLKTENIFRSWKTLITFQAISKTLDCISLWSLFLSMKRLPNSPAVGFTIKIKIYVLWTAGDFLIL